MIGLSELRKGQVGRVVAIGGEAAFRRRLCELGLTVAGRVTCYAEGAGKRTAVYLTDGGLLALRRQDAALILCEPEGEVHE